MALVNIPRDRKDQFYRYKMPELIAKVEGRGNGIKTVIVNMSEIAKALDRPASYPTKYFGFELGALTTADDERDKYIVNGKHDQHKLAEVLDQFIEKFVLCHCCERNPETKMILKGDSIELKCKACGGRNPVDMRHKLTTFITKNPPPKDRAEMKVADRQAERTKLTSGTPSKGSSSKKKGEESTFEGDEITPAKGSRKKRQEEDDDVVWHTDTSAEAVEERRRQLIGEQASELMTKLFVAKPGEYPADKIRTLLAGDSPSVDQTLEQIAKLKEECSWDDQTIAKNVFTELFDKNILAKLKSQLVLLRGLASTPEGQRGIIDGLAELCGVKFPDALLKSVSAVLKTLYDEDVVEEEVIIKWFEDSPIEGADSDGGLGRVKASAQPLVDWLKNAEEEEDEDEEDD